jgi:hypothetical protein
MSSFINYYEPLHYFYYRSKSIYMRISILALIFFFSLSVSAQDTLTCGFENLYTIKPGMSKADAMELVKKNYEATLVSSKMEKLPPYKGTGGDSIVKEILSYQRDVTPCFRGSNTLLQLEFADNKLFKAYISTEFPKSGYEDMMSNYNFLRGVLKRKWKYEKATKISGGDIVGFGYDYTKTQKPIKPGNKIEQISLQYIEPVPNDPKSDYLLEMLWVNLKDTRMESSNY